MNEEKCEIVPAGPDQEEEVIDLWARLMDTYGKKANPALLRKSYRYAVAHPEQVKIFAFQRDGKVLGTVSLHLGHFSTWNNSWYGHAEDLFVDPGARRQGVAVSLMKHIIKVAQEEKLSRLELNTLMDNRVARSIYEKLGFQCSSVVYDLPLLD